MNKTISILISILLIIGIGFIFAGSSKSQNSSEVKDGVQYLVINAKAGYSPKVTEAKAGIPTKLIIKTNDTYDCSASLVIHSIGYQKILKQTGEEVIDIGIPKTGVPLQGVCGMGMYSFVINFS